MIDKYETLLSELEASKTSILESAHEEAMDIIARSNRVIEQTIKEIKEAQAARKETHEAREKIRLHQEQVRKARKTLERKKEKGLQAAVPAKILKRKLEVGDKVKIQQQNTVGEILEIKKNKAKVLSGNITLTIPLDQLQHTVQEKQASFRKSPYKGIIDEINKKATEFTTTLDVRGKRAEEALSLLQRYIDDAMLVSAKEVRVVHGKGDGILRSVIRNYLKSMDEIEHFGDEHVERGGDGITVILFR